MQPLGRVPALSAVQLPVKVVEPMVADSVAPALKPDPVAAMVVGAGPELGDIEIVEATTVKVAVPEWPWLSLTVIV